MRDLRAAGNCRGKARPGIPLGNANLDKGERVAQLVEHRPFKALVLGSSPSPLTISSLPFWRYNRSNHPLKLSGYGKSQADARILR
jgi:hypothetical protein